MVAMSSSKKQPPPQKRSALLEQYFNLYKQDPKSLVFAPLVEMLRQVGRIDEAYSICHKGILNHPHFSSGHVAMGLIYLDLNKLELASEHFERATVISPEKIYVYELLSQIWLKLRNPLKTLKVCKMILFLDPNHKRAKAIVKKLEPITAKAYDQSGFAFKNIKEVAENMFKESSSGPSREKKGKALPPPIHPEFSVPQSQRQARQFEARCAILEALIYRKEFQTAGTFLSELQNIYSHKEEYRKTLEYLEKRIHKSAKDGTLVTSYTQLKQSPLFIPTAKEQTRLNIASSDNKGKGTGDKKGRLEREKDKGKKVMNLVSQQSLIKETSPYVVRRIQKLRAILFKVQQFENKLHQSS